MQRRQGAVQAEGSAHLGERQIGLALQVLADGPAMLGKDLGLAPGEVMTRLDTACASALLEQLLDHAKGNAKAPGDLVTGAFVFVVGCQDTLAQIDGKGCHHEV